MMHNPFSLECCRHTDWVTNASHLDVLCAVCLFSSEFACTMAMNLECRLNTTAHGLRLHVQLFNL